MTALQVSPSSPASCRRPSASLGAVRKSDAPGTQNEIFSLPNLNQDYLQGDIVCQFHCWDTAPEGVAGMGRAASALAWPPPSNNLLKALSQLQRFGLDGVDSTVGCLVLLPRLSASPLPREKVELVRKETSRTRTSFLSSWMQSETNFSGGLLSMEDSQSLACRSAVPLCPAERPLLAQEAQSKPAGAAQRLLLPPSLAGLIGWRKNANFAKFLLKYLIWP